MITIGELSARSGMATSALRYYEREGLIRAERTGGNQRRFPRSELRRVAFIRAAQNVGLTLEEIREALATLPDGRTPTRADWERLSRVWRHRLEERIAELERLRDKLTSCIGCGCLSLQRCKLYNPGDRAARAGAGARYLLGDTPQPMAAAEREDDASIS
ncbi:MAG: redox-sensitive transcriptional activator SoxR [Myxococcaceae bacterium]|nr:redox-sensitive transcriptional activator SoxR [Myxococcaceae bacterium]